MKISNLLDLYNLESSTVDFKHVESNELIPLAIGIENFKYETQNKYNNDEHLIDFHNFLRKIFYKLVGSLLPYSRVISKDLEQELLAKFNQIKNSYPNLFSSHVINIAKSFKNVIDCNINYLSDYLSEYINNKADLGFKIAIVTKRAITVEERLAISHKLKSSIKINYYTENSFRKEIMVYDDVIYIGNPNYFNEYARNTFKGRSVTFISYDMFNNTIIPKRVFEDIGTTNVFSTLFEKTFFKEPLVKKSNLDLEQNDSLDTLVEKFIEEQKKDETNSHDAVEACIVYLENERFLFAPVDSKIRIFTPQDKNNSVKQVNFKDVEEDDYIVIRNERDTKLIAEVADHDVLKSNAKYYRKKQTEWKNKLRYNVRKKGLNQVCDILYKKYKMKTASIQSVRSWCNEDSICPTELPKLLKALKYDENYINETYKIMKEIQQAHRKAGRIISKKLMNELSTDIYRELQEKGFYTFMSSEFDGASFNIERIVSIKRSRHLITPSNLMKPMKLD